MLLLNDKRLLSKEAENALGKALAGNSTIKELDVSSNDWTVGGRWAGDGPGCAQELAISIKDNRAPLSEGVSVDVKRGYSDTYVHLGRKAAAMIAPDIQRSLPLNSASIMEVSMVTGLLISLPPLNVSFVMAPISRMSLAISTASPERKS